MIAFLIQSIDKRLPFKRPQDNGWVRRTAENKSGNVFVTDNYSQINNIILSAAKSGKKKNNYY